MYMEVPGFRPATRTRAASRLSCGSCVAVPYTTHVIHTWFLEGALRERESRFRAL